MLLVSLGSRTEDVSADTVVERLSQVEQAEQGIVMGLLEFLMGSNTSDVVGGFSR